MARIAEPENIRLAFWKAAKSKWSRPATRAFAANLEPEVARLSAGLADGSFPFGAYRSFRVFDPKERWIHAAAFSERVAHHAIMNLCEPVFERAAVFDSYACRKGKGQVAAGERARHYAQRFPWFLKMDVRYMDDFALWHPDKEFLKNARNRITAWLADERGLTVKPEPLINRADRGMDFLGLRVLPHTVRLNHRSKIRFLRRLRGLEAIGICRPHQRGAIAMPRHLPGGLHAPGRHAGLPPRRAFSKRKRSGRRPNGSNRVIHGGSWNNNANNTRCANRNNNWPNNANNNNGFRHCPRTAAIRQCQRHCVPEPKVATRMRGYLGMNGTE